MSDLGELKYILGIQVDQTKEGIKIHQEQYINELVNKFNMADCNGVNIPMDPGLTLVKHQSEDEIIDVPYASLIGSLLYLSNCTRPDVTYAVNRLSSFNANPTEIHWKAAKRVLRYLKQTKTKGLFYSKNNLNELHGFCDSDWANNLIDRRSTTGYLFMLNGNVISWNSKRQTTVAASTAEAEYMALFEGTKEMIWLLKLLGHLNENTDSNNLACDNQSAIAIAKNPVHHQRTKHIDIKYHFIREKVNLGLFKLYYLPSKEMLADILTKPLPLPAYSYIADKLNLRPFSLRGSVGNKLKTLNENSENNENY